MNMQTALGVAKDPKGDMTAYREALEYLIANRASLPYRIFVNLPGGLRGNSDPVWQTVKDGSEEICNCGNERQILPLKLRDKFETDNKPVVVSAAARVYLRPVGGDRESCYMSLEITEGALTFMSDPYSPSINFAALFSRQGYPLQRLSEVCDQKPTMVHGKARTPLFQIIAADPAAGTVTIDLDKDIEAFDPEQEKPRHA